jgi:hypothetical protein
VDKNRITEITRQVNGQFFKDFGVWYKETVKEKIKSETTWKESKFQLLKAPSPHRPLKKGYLFKLGNNVKNWKRRFFVAYNKNDNYILKYYEDASMTKLKGTIDCCG